MQSRERIPKDIIEKYDKLIFFMVDKDQYHMEVVEQFIWIMLIGYEMDSNTLDAYYQHLLGKLMDEKEERFGTYKEKDLDLHKKFTELTRKRKVRKEVKEVAEQIGISKEAMQREMK